MKFEELNIPALIDKVVVKDWIDGGIVLREFVNEDVPTNYNLLVVFEPDKEDYHEKPIIQFLAFFVLGRHTNVSIDYDSSKVSTIDKLAELLSEKRFK